jgi:hypothetical protein
MRLAAECGIVRRSFLQPEDSMPSDYDPLAHLPDPNDRFQVFA